MSKKTVYWICQIVGWIFYAFTFLFFSYVLEKELKPVFYNRLFLQISLGIIFTHWLRYFINNWNLQAPLNKRKWQKLFFLLCFILIFYNFTNSILVEFFKLYDVSIKIDIFKRFLVNLVFDSPIIILWLSFYYVWHYIELNTKTEIQQLELNAHLKELELKTIKYHINPHFIFNALNCIRALVDENPNLARNAITQLSNILRNSLQIDKIEQITLEKELNIVRDYLSIEKIRFENRLNIVFEVDNNLLNELVPMMMIQILAENAIKHGIDKTPNNGFIKIRINFLNENQFEIKLTNSGFYNNQNIHDGFGLNSTINRLEILYGKNAHFKIQSNQHNEVEAVIILPLNKTKYDN